MTRQERPDNEIVGDTWSETWDVEEVVNSLNADVSLYKDVMYGCGYKLNFRDPVELQLFPENRRMSVRRPYLKLDMSNVVKVGAEEDKVVIEAGDVSSQAEVVFRSTGELIFSVYDTQTLKALQSPGVEEIASEQPQAEPVKVEKKQNDRVTMYGRIGPRKDVGLQITTTASGKKLLKFPLAVTEDQKTVFHDVVFYDDKAEEVLPILQEARENGQPITLVGFKK